MRFGFFDTSGSTLRYGLVSQLALTVMWWHQITHTKCLKIRPWFIIVRVFIFALNFWHFLSTYELANNLASTGNYIEKKPSDQRSFDNSVVLKNKEVITLKNYKTYNFIYWNSFKIFVKINLFWVVTIKINIESFQKFAKLNNDVL